MEYASGPAESPFEPKKRTFARTGTTNELGREEIDIHVCVVCLCGVLFSCFQSSQESVIVRLQWSQSRDQTRCVLVGASLNLHDFSDMFGFSFPVDLG